MPKPRKNSTREERIDYEIVVDAYGPEERAMGWYYYLEDKLRFPFRAKCTASQVVSPLKKGETVEVLRLAPEDACTGDVLVLIRWCGRKVAIPLSQLTAIDENESADQALADWKYWVAQGYRF
jgi:Calcium binding